MISSLDLTNALGGTGNTGGHEMNGLVVITFGVVVAGLIVLVAIALSNWRATKALKTARKKWASTPVVGPIRAFENNERPDPLRKAR